MRAPLSFAAGLLGGLAVAGCLGGIVSYSLVKMTEAKVRRGWNLVPVVVYAKDVAAGDVVGFDQISQRSVPEQLVTSSVVKPDSASYVVNQPARVPALAGDVALWAHFEVPDRKLSAEATEACVKKFPPRRVASPGDIRAGLEGK
jgi:Flp pilus assembly protein CpaB